MNILPHVRTTAFACAALAMVAGSTDAAESGAFGPDQFELKSESAAAQMDPLLSVYRDHSLLRGAGEVSPSSVRVPLSIGPVRIDYGVPLPAGSPGERNLDQRRHLDAPGPGYLKQIRRLAKVQRSA
jgi:hypothetical protein